MAYYTDCGGCGHPRRFHDVAGTVDGEPVLGCYPPGDHCVCTGWVPPAGVTVVKGHEPTTEELVARIERRTTDYDVILLTGRMPALLGELQQLRDREVQRIDEILDAKPEEHTHLDYVVKPMGQCTACDVGRVRYFALELMKARSEIEGLKRKAKKRKKRAKHG